VTDDWIASIMNGLRRRIAMEIPDTLRTHAAGPVASTLDGWAGSARDLDLGSADRDLLDLVLCVYPDLRATACLGQMARDRGLQYPITDLDQLVDALGGSRIELGEHVVEESTVRDAMSEEPLPLMHEGEFLSAVHRALVRCRVRESLRRHAAARTDGMEVEEGTRRRP
jgi:hypothetical protein